MNTLSKALAVFCVLLSATAYGLWSHQNNWIASGKATGAVALTTSADGKTVYYAHSGNLFKSTDGGETWASLQ
jgi:photosystem II stability/assembly factor-like uncharacterized protein